MDRIKKKSNIFIKKKIDVKSKKELLEAWRCPQNINKNNSKIFSLACKCDRDDIVDAILKDSLFEINKQDEFGQSPIFHATISGSIDCFNIILKYDQVDLSLVDCDQKNVLIHAVESNQFLFVDKLLQKLTNDNVIEAAIQYVIRAKNSEALAILADYEKTTLDNVCGETNFFDKKQYTALQYAAKRGLLRAVEKLVYAGSKVPLRNVKESPLILAHVNHHFEVLSQLLTFGHFNVHDLKWMKSSKWVIYIYSAAKGSWKSKQGNTLQELLVFFKNKLSSQPTSIPKKHGHSLGVESRIQSSKVEDEEGEEHLYLLCQNIKENVDIIDAFPLHSIVHATFVNCSLYHVPKTFKNIKRLAFYGCKVESYDNLGQFQELRVLTISHSPTGVLLPNGLENCQKLTFLNVSKNQCLYKLSSWLAYLPLTYLSVRENNLQQIPELLPKTIRVLCIQNNQIERLSPFLAQLPKLLLILLNGNPLVFPELSIAKTKTKFLLQYLKAFLTDTVANNSLKLSLVGEERAGKSTLLEALKSPNGVCEEGVVVDKTDGLEISNVSFNWIEARVFDLAGDIDFIETHTMFISEGTLFLAVFDLRSYTLSTSSYFFGRLEIWLSCIYAQAPNSRVILVGTHADGDMITVPLLEAVWRNLSTILENARAKHSFDFRNNPLHRCLLCSKVSLQRKFNEYGVAGYVTLNEFLRNNNNIENSDGEMDDDVTLNQEHHRICFPHIVGYFEVSSLRQIPRKVLSNKNISIEQLKECIFQNSTEIISRKPQIPKKWLALKDHLVRRVEKQYPIISYQEFADLAYSCGFNDNSDKNINSDSSGTGISSTHDDEISPFLRHFHSCGELLYYFEIDELYDVIIIDPQWLSNQLRSVISYRNQNLVDEGIIHHEDLKSTWVHLNEFNQQKLILLFRQAGVFIPFNEHADLIPCRLPVGRPSDDIWPIQPNTTIITKNKVHQIDYLFEFANLPPSFFSHLIAMIEAKKRAEFTGKMQPVYYSNHIVYSTNSTGILCDVHCKNSFQLTDHNQQQDQHADVPTHLLLVNGVKLVRFLSLNVRSVDSLLDAGRNSTCISVGVFSDFDEYSLSEKSEKQTKRHRIHFELLPHANSITLSIRGLTPCCIAPETIDMLNRIRLIRYYAIDMEFYLLCPICVRKSLQSPSKFSLCDIEHIDPVCERGHELISWENVLTGVCDYQPVLTPENIVISLNDYDCPRLFLMMPVNLHSVGIREFYTLTYLKEGFAVHLLCEYPDCWHFLDAPGYRISRPKEFLKKYGKRVHTLLRVLSKLEIPARLFGLVSETGSNVADLISSLNVLATNLASELEDFRDTWSHLSNNTIEEDVRYLKSNDGLKRRELRKFLNKADEEKRFGDLLPTFMGGTVHWLCEKHNRSQTVPC